MPRIYDLTVGDKGLKISGTIQHEDLKQISNLSGWSASFSYISEPDGTPIINADSATIDTFDQPTGTVHVTWTLKTAMTAGEHYGVVRFTLASGDGTVSFSSPGPRHLQSIVRINA